MKLDHGMRCTLRLEEAASTHVAYAVEVETPDGDLTGTASISVPEGRVTAVGALPEEALTLITGLLRAEWRARRGEVTSPWPRRITRWRDPRRADAK